MKFVRFIARFVFSLGAVLLLLFSVCLLGLCAYSVFLVTGGQQAPLLGAELAMAPVLGLAVLLSCCYILVGKYKWLFYGSAGLLLVCIVGALALIVAGVAGFGTPWAGDEINMGLGIGGYCLFLLAGVWLKGRGFWDDGC